MPMKLAYSPASPYVRKVTACAIKRGIDRYHRSGALEV
jgi:glutathione S-transferase